MIHAWGARRYGIYLIQFDLMLYQIGTKTQFYIFACARIITSKAVLASVQV